LVYLPGVHAARIDIIVNRQLVSSVLALAGLGLLAASAHAQRLYRYVDENGNVFYSDRVLPEHSRQDREVINGQGVTIGTEQGEITEEERAIMEAERLAEEERLRIIEEQQRRDRALLDTYLTADDIAKLRDRRLELIDAQITVTEIYLRNLRNKLEDLLQNAGRYAPRSDREDAPPLPQNLLLDIERTESSIGKFEQLLDESRTDQDTIRREFQSDIERFRELKGIDA